MPRSASAAQPHITPFTPKSVTTTTGVPAVRVRTFATLYLALGKTLPTMRLAEIWTFWTWQARRTAFGAVITPMPVAAFAVKTRGRRVPRATCLTLVSFAVSHHVGDIENLSEILLAVAVRLSLWPRNNLAILILQDFRDVGLAQGFPQLPPQNKTFRCMARCLCRCQLYTIQEWQDVLETGPLPHEAKQGFCRTGAKRKLYKRHRFESNRHFRKQEQHCSPQAPSTNAPCHKAGPGTPLVQAQTAFSSGRPASQAFWHCRLHLVQHIGPRLQLVQNSYIPRHRFPP